jgi:broad specificity phosphatase PhoE
MKSSLRGPPALWRGPPVGEQMIVTGAVASTVPALNGHTGDGAGECDDPVLCVKRAGIRNLAARVSPGRGVRQKCFFRSSMAHGHTGRVTNGLALIEWARHGQNVANLTNTLSHRRFDGDLTDLGRKEASELGLRVKLRDLEAPTVVICSPLRRAAQTAEIVGALLGLDVTEDEALREIDVGSLDGRSDAEAWARYASTLSAWRRGNLGLRFPDGENCWELIDRIAAALTNAIRTSGCGSTLVIAHGANIRAALPWLTNTPDPGVDLPTAGIARLRATRRSTGDLTFALERWGPLQT